MKKYSSKRAKKNKLAFRTPSSFIYRKQEELLKEKSPKRWQKQSRKGNPDN